MKKIFLIFVMIIVLSTFGLAVANPAAKFCKTQGNDYKIKKDVQGNEYGVCITSDGKENSAWDYYKDNKKDFLSDSVKSVPKDVKEKKNLIKKFDLFSKDVSSGLLEVITGSHSPEFDWRNYNSLNWISPIKNQGTCGSCWAFSVVGVSEAKVNIDLNINDYNIDLSEQDLVSCSSAGSCSGGNEDPALEWMKNNGIVRESCFPYTASDEVCNNRCANWPNELVKIDYQSVPADVESIKEVIANNGPITVYMIVCDNFDGVGIDDHVGDVYLDGSCFQDGLGCGVGSCIPNLHAVSIVGYSDSESYWIGKNSWGNTFGNQGGYFKIAYQDSVYDFSIWYDNFLSPAGDDRVFFLDESYVVTSTDIDNDGIDDSVDNCFEISNSNQLDTDTDDRGNACDLDDDNDGILDVNDDCPLIVGVSQYNGCPDTIPPTISLLEVSNTLVDVLELVEITCIGVDGDDQVLDYEINTLSPSENLDMFKADLKYYPEPFIVNGLYDESTVIVVGDNAPASDTLAAVDIATNLQWLAKQESEEPIPPDIVIETKLASEVTNPKDYHLILVGNPTNNPLVEEFGVTSENWDLPSGEALIKFVDNWDKVALIVAGTDIIDTRMAGKVVANFEDYDLSGSKVIISGDITNPIISLQPFVSTYFNTIEEGEYIAGCIVTDDNENSFSKIINFIVDVNEPPIIDYFSIESEVTITEEEAQTFSITKSDPDFSPFYNTLTTKWYLDGIDTLETSDSYIYTADYDSAGIRTVTVVVSDGEFEVSKEWTLTILDVNRNPVLDLINDIIVNENDLVSIIPTAIDLDGDEFTFSFSSPLNENGEWQTNYDNQGTYVVTVTVTDVSDGQDSQDVTITVNNVVQTGGIVCNEIYDDFSGETLDLIKWEEYVESGTAIDEHNLDVTNQNYHTEQLSIADRGIELKMLQQLQSGDIIEFDVNYNSASGNHWGCAFWDEQADWSLVDYVTCLGHWNEGDAYGGNYGTYHYQAKYNDNSIDITRTLPDGTDESWRGFEGAITPPYGFSIHSRTGGDGISHFDFDNFKLCEVNYEPEILTYSPLTSPVVINEGESISFTHTSTDQNINNILSYSWKLDGVEKSTGQEWTFTTDLSSSGNYVVTLGVSDSNMETAKSWDVTVKDAGSPPSPSGGGGGGGSGGGGTKLGEADEIIIGRTSQIVTLKTSTRVVYSLNNKGHYINLEGVYDDYITLTIHSDPFNVDLYVGDNVRVDSDGNGKDDLLMRLENLFSTSAKITFKVLKEVTEEVVPETKSTEEAGSEVTGAVTGLFGKKFPIKMIFALLGLAILLGGGYTLLHIKNLI